MEKISISREVSIVRKGSMVKGKIKTVQIGGDSVSVFRTKEGVTTWHTEPTGKCAMFTEPEQVWTWRGGKR